MMAPTPRYSPDSTPSSTAIRRIPSTMCRYGGRCPFIAPDSNTPLGPTAPAQAWRRVFIW